MTHPKWAAALAAGDVAAIVQIGAHAMLEAGKGNDCQCAEPELTGRDLMCGACLLENRGQRERRQAESRAAHPFVEHPDDGTQRSANLRRLGMCKLCTGWRNDPRHTEAG